MNWLTVLAGLYKLVPYVVAGIETIHANESTQSKTQLAQDALSIATQAASQVLSPNNATIANAVSGAVTAGITSAQAVIATIKNPASVTTAIGQG